MKLFTALSLLVLVCSLGFAQSQDVSQLNTPGYPIQLVGWKHGDGEFELDFTFKSLTAKNILAFKFEGKFIDAFGETVTYMGDEGNQSFRSDDIFKAGSTEDLGYSVLGYDVKRFRKLIMWNLTEVAFDDDTIWKNESGKFQTFKVTIAKP